MPGRSVLMVCRSVRGGMKQHLSTLVRGLTHNGVRVTVITLPIRGNPLTWKGIYSVYTLARLIKQDNYDLVHTHGYVAGFIGRLAALAAGQRLLVHTVHNCWPGSFSPLVLYCGKKMEAYLSQCTDRIIVVSEYLKKELIASGVSAHKISTVYNGIDLPPVDPLDRNRIRMSLRLPPHSFVIGTVARLIPAKGVDLFITALSAVKKINPQVKGIIVGDGPARAELQNLAASVGAAGDILFLGHRDDVPALLAAFDLFVLASREEGFGISVLEAQHAGLPVIASRAGGLPEIISHGDNGLLFPVGDHGALADLISLLVNNPDYRRTLAEAGQKKAQEQYTCDRMVNSTLQLYEELF